MSIQEDFEQIHKGNNFIELDPGWLRRLLHQKSYMIVDYQTDDGRFAMDRYFVRNEITIQYPHRQSYLYAEYPHCRIYDIAFAEADQQRVDAALREMYDQSGIFTSDNEYEKSCEHFLKTAYAAVGSLSDH